MQHLLSPREYRIDGPWLHVRRRAVPPQLLHWGHEIRAEGWLTDGQRGRTYHWLRLEIGGRALERLDVAPTENGPWRRLEPASRRLVRVRPRGAKPQAVEISAARSDRERAEAMTLLADRHYLPPPHSGAVLIARPAQPPGMKPPPLAGCLVLGRLMHGSPLGRAAIYRHERRQPDGQPRHRAPSRHDEVHALGLAWISRVAVAEAFAGSGLASALCEAARAAAPRLLANGARWLELLRRVPGSKFAGLIGGTQSDFLITPPGKRKRSGFMLFERELSSKPGVDLDPRSGLRLPRAAGKTFEVMTAAGETRIIKSGRDYMAYYYAPAEA